METHSLGYQSQTGEPLHRASSAGRRARRCAGVIPTPRPSVTNNDRRYASVEPLQSESDRLRKHSKSRDGANSTNDANCSATSRRPVRSVSVIAHPPVGPLESAPQQPQRSMSVMPPRWRRPSAGCVGFAASSSAGPVGVDIPDGMQLAADPGRDEHGEGEKDEGDDIFAPTDERVQTVDFSRMRTQSIQITKNELRRKKHPLEIFKKQVKNFFLEERTGPETDEHGNVELPMRPFVQSREDHDSGLLPSQQLFRLARHEQQELQDRSLQHQHWKRRRRRPSEGIDDYDFAWIVKRASQHPLLSARSCAASVVHEDKCDGQDASGTSHQEAIRSDYNTCISKIGSSSIDFQERLDIFLQAKTPNSIGVRSECLGDSEQAKLRRAQLLGFSGLVDSPGSEALSPDERDTLQSILQERSCNFGDGEFGERRFLCECCSPVEKTATTAGMSHSAAKYYDLLFAHRKNDSFTVRFDMVHCLPRFLLHYKFHKQLYDCLDASERRDLVKAAMDITMSYNVGNCTLQIPHGKYRTNAYPAFFAYIIVPDHARYLEIFEVCNPPAKPGMPRKKNSCVIPNWPDKSFLTEFWTYSNESTSPSDKDPRLSSKLYEKNVLRKLEQVKMPELLVTRQKSPSELVKMQPARRQRGDFDRFEDFVLIPHQEQAMLGFGSVHHPKHAKETRSPQPDIEFLHRLLQAMNSYVRRHINTRQRRLDGREDLSCTVNLSLHHSYTFKGHQRVYGFIGFPPASTYWAALVREQRRNAAVAETAVTQEDIRLMRAANARAKSNAAKSRDQEDREDGEATEASADRTEVNPQDETEILEKLKSCNFL